MSLDDPLAPSDPLESAPPPERVNYETGVLLDAVDFRDEQTYHRGRLAVALRHLVGFGTLAGLRVRPPAEGDGELELSVDPGVAIDRHGRLIEVQAPQCIRLARWFEGQSTPLLRSFVQRSPRVAVDVAIVADVFLSAETCARGKTPAFASGPFDALDAVVPSRLAESPYLELVPRAEDAPAPIPVPTNSWPGSGATRDEQLQNVLASWEGGSADRSDQGLDPLAEHVVGRDAAAVLLARVAIPIVLAAGAPADTRPQLLLTERVSTDNGVRPFVYLPGKWLGRAVTIEPLVQP